MCMFVLDSLCMLTIEKEINDVLNDKYDMTKSQLVSDSHAHIKSRSHLG